MLRFFPAYICNLFEQPNAMTCNREQNLFGPEAQTAALIEILAHIAGNVWTLQGGRIAIDSNY